MKPRTHRNSNEYTKNSLLKEKHANESGVASHFGSVTRGSHHSYLSQQQQQQLQPPSNSSRAEEDSSNLRQFL